MLFNSYVFLIFFLVVYPVYRLLPHRNQNLWILLASYVFYGWWDWRFLSLLWLTTVMDYWFGKKLGQWIDPGKRKACLIGSVVINLAILALFKYFNFFMDNAAVIAGHFGVHLIQPAFRVILPVGISFYTFQSMSYTIDVYRGHLKPARSLQDFALYVAFFPQLVAGPIERATNLLPQMERPRIVSRQQIHEGGWLVLLGFYKKVFIADNLAYLVEPVFNGSHANLPGVYVLIGVYAFAFQIYCDFAGYSDIARGIAKWMGVELMVNFRMPYFAANPSEFWQRWHISLSTWLRDYLYIPLGGNRGTNLLTYRNLMVTMLLGGLWHGASWTFVIWGLYHGCLLVLHRLLKPLFQKIVPEKLLMSGAWHAIKVVLMFHAVCLGWLIFRANSVSQAWSLLLRVLNNFHLSQGSGLSAILPLSGLTFVLLLLQYFKEKTNDLYCLLRAPYALRVAVYYLLSISILCFGAYGKTFIYFQF